MFPWTLDELGPIIVGRPMVRVFQEIFEAKTGMRPSDKLLNSFCDNATGIRQSTFSRFGVEFMGDFVRSETFQKIEGSIRGYQQWFRAQIEFEEEFKDDPRYQDLIEWRVRMDCAFLTFIKSILWTENFWINACERGGTFSICDEAGPMSSLPLGSFSRISKCPEEQIGVKHGRLIEHHMFMVYAAAFELDAGKLKDHVTLPRLSQFVPLRVKGNVRYPMWRFWMWLKEKARCDTWEELAEKGGFNKNDDPDNADGVSVVKRRANAKPGTENEQLISWKRLRKILWAIEGSGSEPMSPLKIEVHVAYGIARILQEHAARCLPTILEVCSDEFPLQSFYEDRIEACKQNECRRIPPALIASL